MKIEGSVALVTGASSGIGEATAQRLAMAGYKVYGTSRRGAQAGQRSFEMLPLDVTSDESVEAAVREVMRRGRPHRPAREQRRLRCRARRSGREFDRAGPVDLRYQLLRDRPHDPCRRAPHATPGKWSHHQHRLGAGFPADAVRGALCRNQACGRRLFGVARS